MSTTGETLLPDGVETTFAEIESTMARLAAGGPPTVSAARSLTATATATVVAVGPPPRLVDAAAALKAHAHAGGIRAILIASGDRSVPHVRVTAAEIALEGLRPDFVDNAVAALRLPSLPALLWWRGGEPALAEELAPLGDRLVLDADNPEPVWGRVERLLKDTPVSDLRWTALTRWRALMAHFFDMPAVSAAASRFTRLRIKGSDAPSARLFAGWLRAALQQRELRFEFVTEAGAAIGEVVFGNEHEELSLRRLPRSACVEARARLDGRETSRIASLGNQTLAALIAQELRVRSRDPVFESAVRFAGAAG